MKLKSPTTDDLPTIVPWLSAEENYSWLDFGNGIQKISAPIMKMMMQRKIHEIRLFTADESVEPIGIVALSDVNTKFKSAVVWFLLGNKKFHRLGYTSRAVSRMLSHGFEKMNLESVFAWTLEQNFGSQKILERNGFQFIGRRRNCHPIDGRFYDRFLYDILKNEHLNR